MPLFTPEYGLPTHELTDSPDGASLSQDLAQAVEDTLSDGTQDLSVNEITTTSDVTVGGDLSVSGYMVSNDMSPTTTENATNEGTPPGTSFVAPSNGAGHSFVAPPSGIVMVIVSDELHVVRNSGSARVFASFRIGEGGTVGAGTEIFTPSINISLIVGVDGASGDTAMSGGSMVHFITGLTPGDTYNCQWQWRDAGSPSSVGSLHRRITTMPMF